MLKVPRKCKVTSSETMSSGFAMFFQAVYLVRTANNKSCPFATVKITSCTPSALSPLTCCIPCTTARPLSLLSVIVSKEKML